jgi:hypothetical protein
MSVRRRVTLAYATGRLDPVIAALCTKAETPGELRMLARALVHAYFDLEDLADEREEEELKKKNEDGGEK